MTPELRAQEERLRAQICIEVLGRGLEDGMRTGPSHASTRSSSLAAASRSSRQPQPRERSPSSAAVLCFLSAGHRDRKTHQRSRRTRHEGDRSGNSRRSAHGGRSRNVPPASGPTRPCVVGRNLAAANFSEDRMDTRFLERASAAVGLSLCAAAVFVLAQSTQPVAAQQNPQAQPAPQAPQGHRLHRPPLPPRRFSAPGRRPPARRRTPTSSTPTSRRCRTGDDGARTTSSGRRI